MSLREFLIVAGQLAPMWTIVVLGGGMIAYLSCALTLFHRERAARNLEPPEKLVLLRGPGESLWAKMETLWERLISEMYFGFCAALGIGMSPLLLGLWFPNADVRALLGSGAVLFAAGSIVVVGRMRRIMHERANARLGYFGEQWVAEQLQRDLEAGYRVYHDVPKGVRGRSGNIDHVVIGPSGAAVIETKIRSKPTDLKNGLVAVEYDGRRIAWPRYPNDTKTLDQVRWNAEWLHAFLLRECNVSVPVAQVVAIPGWRVNERTLRQPRVVSGKGVAHAVMQAAAAASNGKVLNGAELRAIDEALAGRCRDVTP